MINFLEETKKDIQDFKHQVEDIVFIGSMISGHQCSWSEFETLADFEYDNGYGLAEIAQDLIIVFSNGDWMHRDEYDGSEWWAPLRAFQYPKQVLPIKRFSNPEARDCTLAEINSEE